MGLPGRPKSIRSRLILVFLLAISPLMFVQIYEHIDGRMQAELTAAHQQQELATAVAARIASDIIKLKRHHQAYAQKLADGYHSQDSITGISRDLNTSMGPNTRTSLVPVPEPQDQTNAGSVGKTQVGGFYVDQAEACFVLSTPVVLADGKRILLQSRIMASEVTPWIPGRHISTGIRAWIVLDSQGRVLECSNYQLANAKSVGLRERSGNMVELGRCAMCSEACVGYKTAIGGTGWKLAVLRPVVGTRNSYQKSMWLIWSVIATVFGLAVVFVMGTKLAQPVRRLALAAQALAVGDYRKRVSVEQGNELATLAQCFNALGISLAGREEVIHGQAEMLAGMAEAARIASSSLNLHECGKSIARVVCVYLGATSAAVYKKDGGDGELSLIGYHDGQPDEVNKRVAKHSATSGEYLLMSRQREVSSETGAEHEAAIVGIPMVTAHGVIGAIVAAFGNNIDQNDLKHGGVRADVLGAFGVHAAIATKNAEVYSQTEKYSEVLEDWVGHLSAVMQVTDAISPSLTLDETLTELARTTASVLTADACGIFLPDSRENLVSRSFFQSDNDNGQYPMSIQAKSITAQAYSEKQYVACSDVLEHPDVETREFCSRIGLRGVLSTPLIVKDRAIGAITIYTKQPREFDEREIRLLTSIGLHTAVIVRNASLYTRELSIAESLQRNLMSEAPDECLGFKFASLYIPASDEARVGGDFYDVIELPNGKVGVVLADVSGKGLSAAIHLAACKYMLKSLMYMYPDNPARVLGELNDALNYYYNLSFFVTLFCGVIDPATGVLRYANAGHPPALLISQNGKLHTWLSCTGTPAGVGQSCNYELCEATIGRSDLILLYTDGVTDATVGGELLGVEGLQKMIFEADIHSASSLVEYVYSQLGRSHNASVRDDIAMLAVSFSEMPAASDKETGGWSERTSCISTGTA